MTEKQPCIDQSDLSSNYTTGCQEGNLPKWCTKWH